jgi:hypothetical protein
MDTPAPSTVGVVSDLLDVNIINITYLIEELIRDKEALNYPSRKVCSSGLDGERVSCLYKELFSRRMDLKRLGSYRRKYEFTTWRDCNHITFTGQNIFERIEVPTIKFLQGAEKKRSYKLAENKLSYGKDYI